MQTSKLNDWLQIVALIGVILSLIFVGYEIRLSRQIAIADVFQQKTALAVQVQQGGMPAELYTAALQKSLSEQPLTPFEKGMLQFYQNPWFQYWENVHFQFEIGLLSEAAWQGSRNSIRSRLRNPMYQEWWEAQRTYWREPFAKEVDAILAEVKASESK
jgi:hypothetical protein